MWASFSFYVSMDLDFVSVHKNAKRELGQYSTILSSRLVNCRIAHILGILLMNSCNTDRFLATTVVYGLSTLNIYVFQSRSLPTLTVLFLFIYPFLTFRKYTPLLRISEISSRLILYITSPLYLFSATLMQ